MKIDEIRRLTDDFRRGWRFRRVMGKRVRVKLTKEQKVGIILKIKQLTDEITNGETDNKDEQGV